MGENNQSSNGDLYLIPEDGGQPIKMPGIISVSGAELASHDELDEMAFSLCGIPDMHFSLELTGKSAKIMNRFSRMTRRYIRRHKQQTKRKSAKERKRNSNQTEFNYGLVKDD